MKTVAKVVLKNERVARTLERSSLIQAVLRTFRLRQLVNRALAHRPIVRRLPSGVVYAIETFESLEVERMYFRDPAYHEIFEGAPPSTFIDLGCNAGLFPCLLADCAAGRNPVGLCIDANAAQVALTRRNIQRNGWAEVETRCGLVGDMAARTGEVPFRLHLTSLGSTQFESAGGPASRPEDWTPVTVPALKVEPLWVELFGARRCECLKVDIEGSEVHFLRQEASLLERADSVLIEWHGWATTDNEVESLLQERGFHLVRVMERADRHGVLFFRRSVAESTVEATA